MSFPADHKLFVGVEGSLYDTSVDSWHKKQPLRAVYSRTYSHIETTAQLKATLRAGPFAWPGGYPMHFWTADGAALSFETVRDELHNVLSSIKYGLNDGWRVAGCDVNWEDGELIDGHSGERIESAYAED